MLTSLIRTVILYIVITVCLRIMGKRQIGEMQSTELVITLLISDLAAIPMQDIGIPLLYGFVPILTLVICEIAVSVLMMKSRRFRRILCGKPTVLIKDGEIQQNEMRQVRCTVEDLTEGLRLQGVFNIADVEFAALETNGQLSVMQKSGKTPPTAEELGVESDSSIYMIVMQEGKFCKRAAQMCGCDMNWINRILKKEKCDREDVFLLSADKNGQYKLVKREKK